jgi:hypothetical protein
VDHRQRLDALRKLQYLLDNVFRVPGTNVRFGWDPIVGLVPWLGDVVTAVLAGTILIHAHRMRVPRVIQVRMFFNTLIDIVVGLVPFVGDVSDVFWKSNAKNFSLLERHAGGVTRRSKGDWLFVTMLVAALAAMALVPLLLTFWLFSMFTAR